MDGVSDDQMQKTKLYNNKERIGVRIVRKAAARSSLRRDAMYLRKVSTPLLFRLRLVSFGWKASFDCSIQLSEFDWVHVFNARVSRDNNRLGAGLHIDTLDVHSRSSGLGVSLLLIVLTNTCLEGLAAGGHANVLDTHVNALGDNAVSNALVHNDTDGVRGHVEDLAGLSVVELVGHTSLDGTISNDINEISFAVRDEVLAEGRHTVLSESLAEKISRASSKTETVGHFSFKPSKYLINIKPSNLAKLKMLSFVFRRL